MSGSLKSRCQWGWFLSFFLSFSFLDVDHFCKILYDFIKIFYPRPGIKPTPPALEGEVLTTGPSKKPLNWFLLRSSLLGLQMRIISLCLHMVVPSVHVCVLISSYKVTSHI